MLSNLTVIADTPLKPALMEIGEAFRPDNGRQVDFVFGPSPVILKKVADGEAVDVLIIQPDHAAGCPLRPRTGLALLLKALPRWKRSDRFC